MAPEKSRNKQILLANAMLALGIAIIFLIVNNMKSFLDMAMLSASTITLFYFWWAYLFIAMKELGKNRIQDYLYDFFALILLLGLFYLTGSSLENKALLWLINYFVLFIAAILKNVFMKIGEKNKRKIRFLKKKIKIDIEASVFIAILIFIAISFKLELFAIWSIFLMEFLHMLWVGFVTKLYEKY